MNITYPVLIEDEERSANNLLGITGFPTNIIINGIPNDPLYEQWEIIHKSSGFPLNEEDQPAYLDEYKRFIESVSQTESPIIRLSSNSPIYFPGDELNVSMRLKYYGAEKQADIFIALMANEYLYFFPSWVRNAVANTKKLEYGYDETTQLLENVPISENIPEGTYTVMAIAAGVGTFTPISNLSSLDFRISHESKGSMKAFFEENPVYKSPTSNSWAFKVFIENTGSFDIGMDLFHIETYDDGGKLINTQDAIKEFHKWFKLLGNILPAGVITNVELTFSSQDITRGGLELYFKGKDENGFEVETRTERLSLLPPE